MKKPYPAVSSGQSSSLFSSQTAKTVLPTGMILLSFTSTQIGSALAKTLFGSFGPVGVVAVRMAGAALILSLIWRSRMRGSYGWKAYALAACFGFILGSMNLTFYLALAQLPLGITVAIEFVGPLLLAVAQSRRVLDIFWVILAAAGIILLTPIDVVGGSSLRLASILLALCAGACWACYVLLSARVGKIFPGGSGLAIATCVAAVILLPAAIVQEKAALWNPPMLFVGASVGLLSTALPYSLEMEALRYIPSRVFSILLSLQPVVAALAGWVILHEQLTWREVIAIVAICVASIGVVVFQKKRVAEKSALAEI